MNDFFETELPRRDFLKMSGTALAAGSALMLPGFAQAENKLAANTNGRLQGRKDMMMSAMALLDKERVEKLVPKDFSSLLGHLDGISDNQLSQHFKLYEKYVGKANELHQAIANADEEMLKAANPTYSAFREMHAEQSYAHNGVVLHELYFGNLGAKGGVSSDFKAIVNRTFGSWDTYIKHLVAVGKSMRGWAITGFDARDGYVRNFGLDLHNQGMPTTFYPILVLDVYEHAYMVDYGIDRGKYLDAFLKNVNWETIDNRLMYAVHHMMAGADSTD
jgi:superoxide dismutase, Fe-Mn family